jgi:2-phospho-L-lactate guanylyltransferase
VTSEVASGVTRPAPVSFVVPVKALSEARSRLGLDRRLIESVGLDMVRRTLEVVQAAVSSGLVVVVTSDPAIARVARRVGASVVREHRPSGVNRAAALGRERALAERPASPVAVLVAGLPLLEAHELDAAVDAFRERGVPAFVPDHHGVGTTCLLHGPEVRPGIAFGRGSADLHTRLGYVPIRGAFRGLRIGLNTPEDLPELASTVDVLPDTVRLLAIA